MLATEIVTVGDVERIEGAIKEVRQGRGSRSYQGERKIGDLCFETVKELAQDLEEDEETLLD